ncbi:hypothetical protein [Mesorhizobium sp. 2RAF21]
MTVPNEIDVRSLVPMQRHQKTRQADAACRQAGNARAASRISNPAQ